MPFIKSLQPNRGPKGIYQQFPKSGRLITELTEILFRAPCTLTFAEREIIAAYTAANDKCQLCADTHSAVTEYLGVKKGLINSLLKDIDTAPYEDKLKQYYGL